jgi:GNAT superfamily N-acetyltransferase
VVCWEALDRKGPELRQARRLYEALIEPAERIPWAWVEEAVARRRDWRPGDWGAHLLLAAPERSDGVGAVVGFAYGLHVPGYGGYACYLAVDPRHRGRGTGTRLLRLFIDVCRLDAECAGEPLPFVVWESRAPGPNASEDERGRWRSRLRLFERVGAWQVEGLVFHAPSFERGAELSVPLQIFLSFVDARPEQFDAAALREVAAGLFREVYRRGDGDPLLQRSLPPDCAPTLHPVDSSAVSPASSLAAPPRQGP